MLRAESNSDKKGLNLLPDNKILDLSKLKAFTDDKLNVTQNLKFVFYRTKAIVGKRKKRSISSNVFKRLFPHWRSSQLGQFR